MMKYMVIGQLKREAWQNQPAEEVQRLICARHSSLQHSQAFRIRVQLPSF